MKRGEGVKRGRDRRGEKGDARPLTPDPRNLKHEN